MKGMGDHWLLPIITPVVGEGLEPLTPTPTQLNPVPLQQEHPLGDFQHRFLYTNLNSILLIREEDTKSSYLSTKVPVSMKE